MQLHACTVYTAICACPRVLSYARPPFIPSWPGRSRSIARANLSSIERAPNLTMATRPSLTLNDVLARSDLERKDLLFLCPRKIKDLVADAIADKWNRLGRTLNVPEEKLKAIQSDIGISGPEDKASATMDAWTEEYGEHATCLKLVEALYRRSKLSIIYSVCEEVQRIKDSPTTTCHRPSLQQHQVLGKQGTSS